MKDSWIIAIDTREKQPLQFTWPSSSMTLTTGDYSIVGMENQIAVERKSLPDFVSTLIRHRERFYRELERFKAIQFRCIIVESDMRKLFLKSLRSRAHPMSIIGLALAAMIDYNIPILFCSTREIAAKVTLSFLHRAYRRITEKKGGQNGECPDV